MPAPATRDEARYPPAVQRRVRNALSTHQQKNRIQHSRSQQCRPALFETPDDRASVYRRKRGRQEDRRRPLVPAGVSRSELCLTSPTTDTVGLVRSVFTIKRIPLGSFVSETSMKFSGTFSSASATGRPCGKCHRLGGSGCHFFGAAISLCPQLAARLGLASTLR